MPETLDSLVEEIMDLAREHPIDEARIYIKDRIEKDAIRNKNLLDRVSVRMFQKASLHALMLADRSKALVSVLNQSDLVSVGHVRPFIENLTSVIKDYEDATYACGKCGAVDPKHNCAEFFDERQAEDRIMPQQR